MPLTNINNGESGASARAKINASFTQVNTNTTTIASHTTSIGTNTTNIATNTSGIAALTTVVSNKQPLDADLTAISALTPSANDTMQFISGSWANRTVAQVKTTLSLNLVDNTSDSTKNAAAVALTNKTGLNTHTIPGGTGTLALTSDLIVFQTKNAVSTLNMNLVSETGDFNINDKGNNAFCHITNTGGSLIIMPASTPSFPNGGSFDVYNDTDSIGAVTLSSTGANIFYPGLLTAIININETARLVKLNSTDWVRVR